MDSSLQYMGAPIPRDVGHSATARMEFFQQYRNDDLARLKMPVYDWGGVDISYAPRPDASIYKKTVEYSRLPPSEFSMLDHTRQAEVDDFYLSCQYHRDQYRDTTGTLQPLNYFKKTDYPYQCPTDPTSQYLKCPEFFTKYKQPLTLPITLERSLHTHSLPERALTGVFNPTSDIVYKR